MNILKRFFSPKKNQSSKKATLQFDTFENKEMPGSVLDLLSLALPTNLQNLGGRVSNWLSDSNSQISDLSKPKITVSDLNSYIPSFFQNKSIPFFTSSTTGTITSSNENGMKLDDSLAKFSSYGEISFPLNGTIVFSQNSNGSSGSGLVGTGTNSTQNSGGTVSISVSNPNTDSTLNSPPTNQLARGANKLDFSDFGPNDFRLQSGMTISSANPFLPTPSNEPIVSLSDSKFVSIEGVDSLGVGFKSDTNTNFVYSTSSMTDSDGSRVYSESFSYTYTTIVTAQNLLGQSSFEQGTTGYTYSVRTNSFGAKYYLDADFDSTFKSFQSKFSKEDTTEGTTRWSQSVKTDLSRTIAGEYFAATNTYKGTDSGFGKLASLTLGLGDYQGSIVLKGAGRSEAISPRGTVEINSDTITEYTFGVISAKNAYGTISDSGSWDLRNKFNDKSTYLGQDLFATDKKLSGAGKYFEVGVSDSNADYNSKYVISNGVWSLDNGNGIHSANNYDVNGFKSAGNYDYESQSALVTGNWNSSNNNISTSNSTSDWKLTNDGWKATTGISIVLNKGNSDSGFKGGSTYTIPAPQSGTGAFFESGNNDWKYIYSSSYSISPDGKWINGKGSGNGFGNDNTNLVNISSGKYDKELPNSGKLNGTWENTNKHESKNLTNINWYLKEDNTWDFTGGSSSNTETDGKIFSYSGNGSYNTNNDGYLGSTTVNESGNDKYDSVSTSNYMLNSTDGKWIVENGASKGSGSGNNLTSHLGSGTYSRTSPDFVGTISGTWHSGGTDSNSFKSTQLSNLKSDNKWEITGGSWDGNSIGNSTYFSIGGGTVTISQPYTGSGTINESTDSKSSNNRASSYQLSNEGIWINGNGSGTAQETKSNGSSALFTGNYSKAFADTGGQISGNWSQLNIQTNNDTTNVGWILNSADKWEQSFGTNANNADKTSQFNYSGSVTVSDNGSGYTGNATYTQTGTELKTDNTISAYNYDSKESKWTPSNGTNKIEKTGHDSYDYHGSGAYHRIVSGVYVDGTWNTASHPLVF